MKNLILIILLIPAFIFSQNKKENKKAQMAATNWLNQIDNGQYLESWDDAAKYFQNQIQKDRWSSALNASRKPLGVLKSRIVNTSEFKIELPGAPDGNYYVIKFDVSYEKKIKATETVTLLKDKNGEWKVVGFYIK